MPKAIWISWERHRRTSTLAEHFGIPLHTLLYSGPAPVRYLVLSIRTTALLFRERPGVLVVQNPSIVLATLAGFLAFGEVPALTTLIGTAIIIGALLLTTRLDRPRRPKS